MGGFPDNTKIVEANRCESPEMSADYEINMSQGQLIADSSGINNGTRIEIVPIYEKANPEKLIQGFGNCTIVLGKDRPNGVGSGYGGKGFTGAAAIDLVAGRISSTPINSYEGKQLYIGNDFQNDAARVYISQLADIDEYIGIPFYEINGSPVAQSTTRENSNGKSAVAIIADHSRIVGRESVKIVTRHFGNISTENFGSKGGIDIIAGYNMPDEAHSLQPMVKGGNLLVFLENLYYKFTQMQDMIQTFVTRQSVLNEFLIHHEHILNVNLGRTNGKSGAQNEIAAMADQAQLLTETTNNALDAIVEHLEEMNVYLTPGSKFYINSKWNRVN
jgi:hypothetical protein